MHVRFLSYISSGVLALGLVFAGISTAQAVGPDPVEKQGESLTILYDSNSDQTLVPLDKDQRPISKEKRTAAGSPLANMQKSSDKDSTTRGSSDSEAKSSPGASTKAGQWATITGKITPATASNKQVLVCEIIEEWYDEDWYDVTYDECYNVVAAIDGSYSVDVTAGSTVIIGAWADGYLHTFIGGLSSMSGEPYLPDDAVTQIQAPAAGQTLAGQNIQLAQGATITGVISPANAKNIYVWICEYVDGWYGDAVILEGSDIAADGSYSYTVRPGVTIVVSAWADGYMDTWIGGYTGFGEMPDLPQMGITRTKTPAVGQTLAGMDIAMVKGSTISGTVTIPAGYVSAGAEAIGVAWACLVDDSWTDPTIIGCMGADINPDGSYEIGPLMPGEQYVVFVPFDEINTSKPGLLTTAYGGFTTAMPIIFDEYLSDPLLTTVIAPPLSSTLANIDITVELGGIISGKITPASADDKGLYFFELINGEPVGYWSSEPVANDGSYAVTAKPGSTVLIAADAYGYLPTFLGGYYGTSFPDLPNPGITQLVAPAAGQTLSGQNIALMKAAVVTGTVSLPAGYTATDDILGFITACQVVTTGGMETLTDCTWAVVELDGSYELFLVPGETYVVYVSSWEIWAEPYDLLTTAYGGWSSWDGQPYDWDLSDPSLARIVAPPDSGTLAGIDIMMVSDSQNTDKSALREAVEKAISLKQSNYTTASWAVLVKALAYAQNVLFDDYATQEEIDEATAALLGAIEDLTYRQVVVQTGGEVVTAKAFNPLETLSKALAAIWEAIA